jgi:hypothetical protein
MSGGGMKGAGGRRAGGRAGEREKGREENRRRKRVTTTGRVLGVSGVRRTYAPASRRLQAPRCR